MPFKSQAQRKWMFARHLKMAKKWAAHTRDIKGLPDRVHEDEEDARANSEDQLNLTNINWEVDGYLKPTPRMTEVFRRTEE